MKPAVERMLDRRSFFTSMGKAAAGASALGLLTDADIEAAPANVQRNSIPSDLKITDLRVAVVEKAPMTCPLIRLDTNQGLAGYGEVRDGASATYALFLKSRLLGENPCNVDRLFRKIKQFGAPARQAGGVCGVEMALWDLAGKAYGVPAYQMLGGKFRDKVRLYADTTETEDPHEQGRRLKKRMESGFTWLKQDFGIDLLKDVPGGLAMPQGSSVTGGGLVMHPFTGIEITDKGIAFLSDWVAASRQEIGMDIPLASDHYGHIGVNSCIRLARAMEKHQLAWMEDMVPWQLPELLKQIKDAVDIPILTGEDIYLKEDFARLITAGAVDIIHPDLASAGGLLEMKKISDFAMEHGVPMAMHFAGTPVSFMANLHTAVAVENFLVLENHSVDVPWWQDLVSGVPKPILDHGFAAPSDRPGLGVELVEEVVKAHLKPGTTYFAPTPEWDNERSWDRLWS
ncbi:MAG: mandelate racemase/muconate lactonizing enzyme family protein [Acidobacteria bacterium]|nr:MAG: mandelate racemase/muconate lactonizing enzyme family protein [Acidobacteriota bacterium]